jgi:hypothetical protein
MAKQLVEKVKLKEQKFAGAKARRYFAAFAARVNSCPDTNYSAVGVFPQVVKPQVLSASAAPFDSAEVRL